MKEVIGELAPTEKKIKLLTGMKSENVHERYMGDHFPDLIKTATPEQDVIELTGEQFIVEESWRVCPLRT